MRDSFTFSPIAYLHSPFKDKFGIPRQPGLVSKATGIIKMCNKDNLNFALKTIDQFSHIWVLFVFHRATTWKPSVRPPRLGGVKRVGVLSSRSPHRPNPIGLSAMKLIKLDMTPKDGAELHVEGVDILDGTPVLDIKPYIEYADSFPMATYGWASAPIPKYKVNFLDEALTKIRSVSKKEGYHDFEAMIKQVLELDPRPASQQRKIKFNESKNFGKKFGFNLLNYDIKWYISDGEFVVYDIEDLVKSK